MVTTMLALEALGYGCTDAGLVFSINAHMWTVDAVLSSSGTSSRSSAGCPGCAAVN